MTPDYVAVLLDYVPDSVVPETLASARRSVDAGAEGDKFASWIAAFYTAAHAARLQGARAGSLRAA